MSSEELVDVLKTNLVSVHNVTAAALPLLHRGTQQKVINM